MSIFSTVVCPRCAPGIGGHDANWGHAKKCLALCAGVCAPNFKTVSAPMVLIQPLAAIWNKPLIDWSINARKNRQMAQTHPLYRSQPMQPRVKTMWLDGRSMNIYIYIPNGMALCHCALGQLSYPGLLVHAPVPLSPSRTVMLRACEGNQCFGLRPNGRIYVRKKCPIRRNSVIRT